MPDRHTSAPLPAVPMLDFQREFRLIREEVLAAIAAVCDSQRFILGPEVARFEAAAARACGVPHAIGCASGTDALWLALAALNIGDRGAGLIGAKDHPEDTPPDAVLTTPFSFFATVSAILRAGAQPILADIDPRTFNLSPESTREAIAAHHRNSSGKPGRLAAILPVHLFGQCADMTAFTAIAAEHNLQLIEDAAQAFGATWTSPDGITRPAGSLSDAAAFSFYPTKNLAAFGDAGLLTTRNPVTAERAAMLRTHGMRRRYFHDEIGWNSRLDTLQAAVLEVKLRYLDAGNARRRQIAALYDQLFRAANLAAPTASHDIADGVVLPFTAPRATPVFHQYVIRAPRRDALRAHLSADNIGSEIYYPLPLHLQKSLAFLGHRPGDFPHAERAAAEVLALPIFPALRDDEIHTVVEAIRHFYA